jgi:O-antigen ligase
VYYSHATPFALVYYISALSIEYWAQKYLLLRKCRIPPKFSSEISDRFIEFLGAMPVLYVLGVYQYTNNFYGEENQHTLSFIIILLVAKLLSAIMIFYFKKKQSTWEPEKTYSEV